MKIGVILPVGDLTKFGYQNNYLAVLRNLTTLFDIVIIISSCNQKILDSIKSELRNVKIISNKSTWFDKQGFLYKQLEKNGSIGLVSARRLQCDIAVQIHINQYFPESSIDKFREYCKCILEEKKDYGWLYKKYQCGRQIFNSDNAVPWIINSQKEKIVWKFGSDQIINQDTGEIVRIKKGDFARHNNLAIVDIFGASTIEEDKGKFEKTVRALRMLNKTLNPKDGSNLVFDRVEWLQYLQKKLNGKTLASESLSYTGKIVAANERPNHVSRLIWSHYPRCKIVYSFILRKMRVGREKLFAQVKRVF